MPTPTLWGYAAFVASVALIIAVAAVGDRYAVAGSIMGLAGMGLGTLGAALGTRPELSDDERRAPLARAVWVAIGSAGPIWLSVVVVQAAYVTWHLGDERYGAVFAVAVGSALVGLAAYLAHRVMGQEGVDREVLLRSASFAFLATMLAVVTYAFFEVFADAPRLSMWAVWTFGMLTWAGASSVVKRRMA